MANDVIFKTKAFGGFNKEEVMTYINRLISEKEELDALFNSGSEIPDIIEKSARYNEIKEMLDEKEMRWLELSEKE